MHQDSVIDFRENYFDIQLSFFPVDTPDEMGGTFLVPGTQYRSVRTGEIHIYQHMRGKSPATYTHLTDQDMIEAIKSIDVPEAECLVQFGAALPMSRIADEAERWLNKPVISINVVTYWHGLRALGINDQFRGFTQLFSRF